MKDVLTQLLEVMVETQIEADWNLSTNIDIRRIGFNSFEKGIEQK